MAGVRTAPRYYLLLTLVTARTSCLAIPLSLLMGVAGSTGRQSEHRAEPATAQALLLLADGVIR
jgi:hypothetical protein